MVRMVNKITGGAMWVHPSRVEEYLAAGHALAVSPVKEAPKTPVKRPPKKTAAKIDKK